MFNYLPSFILESLHETAYRSPHTSLLSKAHYLGTIEKRPTQKSYYQTDSYFCKLLDQAGYDVEKLKAQYRLTPISANAVYKDFSKYHDKLDHFSVPWDALEKGATWLAEHKMRSIKRKCQILNYDEVLDLLDKTKSATAFFNQHFKNKGELLMNDDFKISFVDFLHKYATGQAVYVPWVTIQKEEIRPGEKIDLEKYRSIIIGSIFSLIVGHMLYNDMDAATAENWLEYGTGIGMSCFGGNYHLMVQKMTGAKVYNFKDVGQYDSRQIQFLQQKCVQVANYCYEVRVVSFYSLLGSLVPIAKLLKIADFDVNTYYLRNRLCEDSVFGPTILPCGEIYSTDTGEKSGNHRTGTGNVDRNKIVEFAAASFYYSSLREYHAAGNFNTHTGDDEFGKGPDDRCARKSSEIWRSIGASVDENYTSDITKINYISTTPMQIQIFGARYWVPIFNTAKIFAGLACKLGVRTLDNDVQRLASSQLLSYFSADKAGICEVIRLYKADNPDAIGHPAFKDDLHIITAYIGELQSSFHVFSELPRQLDKFVQRGVKAYSEMSSLAATAGVALLEKGIEKGLKLLEKPKTRRQRKRPAPKPPSKAAIRVPMKKGTSRERKVTSAVRNGYVMKGSYLKKGYGKRKGADCLVVEGQEFMGSIIDTAIQYTDVLELPINPIAIAGTRLQLESALWTKFSFDYIEMEYVPSCGNNTSGQILLSHIEDPELNVGVEGTLAYVDALCSVKGAIASPVYTRTVHRFTPNKQDPREYYISPDVQGETRFTVQGLMKATKMTNGTNNAQLGLFYIKYRVTLYNEVLNVAAIQPFKSLVCSTGAGSQQQQMFDNGAFGNVGMTPSASLMAINTVYIVYFTFGFGGVKPFAYYFYKTDSTTLATQKPLYRTAYDASQQTTENTVNGSFGGTAKVPTNGTCYALAATSAMFAANNNIVKLKPSDLIEKEFLEFHEEEQPQIPTKYAAAVEAYRKLRDAVAEKKV